MHPENFDTENNETIIRLLLPVLILYFDFIKSI